MLFSSRQGLKKVLFLLLLLFPFYGKAGLDEVVDTLKKKVKAPVLMETLEELRENKPVYAIENELTAAQLGQMERMSKRTPFSISPLLVYLELKKYEVSNLRALARGKQAGLDAETLEHYLVM